MGQIANRMVLELCIKLKETLTEKRAAKRSYERPSGGKAVSSINSLRNSVPKDNASGKKGFETDSRGKENKKND